MQLNPTAVAWPSLVVRLREAEPPRAQTLMNSFTDAMMNSEFNLPDMLSDVTEKLLAKQGLPCELEISCYLQLLGAHHRNLCMLQLSSGKKVQTLKAWDLNLNLLLLLLGHDKVFHIMYTVYSLQFTVYTINYTVYSIHYTVYSKQYTLYSIQYTVHIIQYKVYIIQYTIYCI